MKPSHGNAVLDRGLSDTVRQQLCPRNDAVLPANQLP
jgi:hypothetical protein